MSSASPSSQHPVNIVLDEIAARLNIQALVSDSSATVPEIPAAFPSSALGAECVAASGGTFSKMSPMDMRRKTSEVQEEINRLKQQLQDERKTDATRTQEASPSTPSPKRNVPAARIVGLSPQNNYDNYGDRNKLPFSRRRRIVLDERSTPDTRTRRLEQQRLDLYTQQLLESNNRRIEEEMERKWQELMEKQGKRRLKTLRRIQQQEETARKREDLSTVEHVSVVNKLRHTSDMVVNDTQRLFADMSTGRGGEKDGVHSEPSVDSDDWCSSDEADERDPERLYGQGFGIASDTGKDTTRDGAADSKDGKSPSNSSANAVMIQGQVSDLSGTIVLKKRRHTRAQQRPRTSEQRITGKQKSGKGPERKLRNATKEGREKGDKKNKRPASVVITKRLGGIAASKTLLRSQSRSRTTEHADPKQRSRAAPPAAAASLGPTRSNVPLAWQTTMPASPASVPFKKQHVTVTAGYLPEESLEKALNDAYKTIYRLDASLKEHQSAWLSERREKEAVQKRWNESISKMKKYAKIPEDFEKLMEMIDQLQSQKRAQEGHITMLTRRLQTLVGSLNGSTQLSVSTADAAEHPNPQLQQEAQEQVNLKAYTNQPARLRDGAFLSHIFAAGMEPESVLRTNTLHARDERGRTDPYNLYPLPVDDFNDHVNANARPFISTYSPSRSPPSLSLAPSSSSSSASASASSLTSAAITGFHSPYKYREELSVDHLSNWLNQSGRLNDAAPSSRTGSKSLYSY